MAVLVGRVYHESNTFCEDKTMLRDFGIFRGEEMLALLPGAEELKAAGCEVIPSIFAARWSSGTVDKAAFLSFEDEILASIRSHMDELDGIFLSLHGAMTVEELGSGEYHLAEAARRLVGERIPISVSMDMHANNRPGIERFLNSMTGYHTSPHTDAAETQRKAARALIRLMESGEQVHPALVHLPMLLVGERALSADEPFAAIYARCKELEQDERFLAATMYVGMAWSDTPHTASSVAVTPAKAEYAALAREEAEKLARFLFEHRDSCPYAHPTYPPAEAVERALASENRPLYLSDSGDNPTAGGVGDSTVLLRLFLSHPHEAGCKNVLFAPILDPVACKEARRHRPGDGFPLTVGTQRAPFCAPVTEEVTLVRQGAIESFHGLALEHVADFALVRCGTLHIVLVDRQMAFTGMECFDAVGVHIPDYDIVVLKMGYMFDEISAPCRENMMAFTPGATPLLITPEQYHHLQRPIWPLDTEVQFP